MMFRKLIAGIGFTIVGSGLAAATTVPFLESFSTGPSLWRETTGVSDAAWVSTDGADGGGYITQAFSFSTVPPEGTPLLVRAHSSFGSSGGNFWGDWITDGVGEFRASVRHNAPVPLSFFARFSQPFGGQGAVGLQFAPVLPNTWTEIVIAIDPSNPAIIMEGTPFATVFGNVGRIQLGVLPGPLAGSTPSYQFDFDEVEILPEPSAVVLMAVGAALALARRRS